ncbi:MAG: peptidylprolyl isomerase [Paracoccaceae bacterium]|nr:peptidylprolyl isomerase [Paracoccaceae bacterium]
MSKTLRTVCAAALAVGLALPVQAQDTPSVDTVVATVNGTEITLGHMLMVRTRLEQQYQSLPADVLWDGILDQLVRQEALKQAQGTETTRVRIAVENERRALMASEKIADIAAVPITEEEIQAAYNISYVQAEKATEYNASHILVETEETAQDIVAQLEGGADFADLARTASTGPSGPGGGSLGWFGPGMMVEPFQKAVEMMEPGAISAPVQTQFGWHVIKLNEVRDKAAPPLEEVRSLLENELRTAALDAFINATVEAAEVTRTDSADADLTMLDQLELLGE